MPPVPGALSVDGECPGDDLDLRGAGQPYPQQVAVIVVVLEEVAGLGRPGAGPGQAADGDLVDEVVPVTGAVHGQVEHVREREHCVLVGSACHGDGCRAGRSGGHGDGLQEVTTVAAEVHGRTVKSHQTLSASNFENRNFQQHDSLGEVETGLAGN
jgi:hypothetical protein